jgi:hypothetical protein
MAGRKKKYRQNEPVLPEKIVLGYYFLFRDA